MKGGNVRRGTRKEAKAREGAASGQGLEDKQRQEREQHPETDWRKTSKAACFEGVYEG